MCPKSSATRDCRLARFSCRPWVILRQGMLVSVPLHLDALPGRPMASDLEAALAAHYRGSEYVKLVPRRARPSGSRITQRYQ